MADPSRPPPVYGADGSILNRKIEPYTPSEEESAAVARVKSRISPTSRLGNRWALERGWYENILFIQGEQWIDYDVRGKRWQKLPLPSWMPTPVTNEIAPRRERMIAPFLKRAPNARVRPNSTEARDIQAAQNGEYIIAHVDDVVHEEELRQRLATCAVDLGTVISKEWFNPNAGPELVIPEMTLQETPITFEAASCATCGADQDAAMAGQPCPTCGPEAPPLETATRQRTLADGSVATEPQSVPLTDPITGEPVVQRIHIGEIESEVILPFEFYVDDNAETLRQAQWAGQATYRDLEWIERNFPKKAMYVGEETSSDVTSFYKTALSNLAIGNPRVGGLGGGEPLRGGAVVIEYEERPTAEHPKGRLIIITNQGVCLWDGEPRIPTTDAVGELSYTEFKYALLPGRFWGWTPIDNLKPLQRRLNSIDAHLLLNAKTMGNPWVLAPNGCGIKPGSVGLRPGTWVFYDSIGVGTAPQIVQPQALPAQIVQMRDHVLSAMDRNAATEEASVGAAPEGVKSGVALAQLAEAGEMTHQPRMRRWENFVAERGRKRLLLVQKFYREPRIMKSLGVTGWQVKSLQGADLAGNTDVTVEAGSALPRSRMAQLQLIMDLLEAGVLVLQGNETLRQKVLDEVGLRSLDTDLGPDRRKALEENSQMDEGLVPPVGPYELKEVHLAEHLREVRDPRFTQKPVQAQRAYLQHVQQTRAQLFQEMMQEAPANPPPGEEPSGPAGKVDEQPAPGQGVEQGG